MNHIGENRTILTINRKCRKATGLEPAASRVTGRRSNLSEAARANVIENWQTKDVLCEETANTRFDCVSEVGDRAAF